MTSIKRIFPEDELSNDIYKISMDVVRRSKGYFCIVFGRHDALDDAALVFLEDWTSNVRVLLKMYAENMNGPPRVELLHELSPILRELLNSPYFGKPVSNIIMNCRYSILLSAAFSVLCFKKLEEREKVQAISAYGKSEFFIADCMATGTAEFMSGSVRENAWLGALAKLAIDPKQKDKALVRECWDEWQKQPDRYKGKASFARDMLDKFENIKSQPVIEGWCRLWERETITQQAQ